MDASQVDSVLKEHIRLCEDLHELFLEEGRIMRSTGRPPDGAFLDRKREFLPVLDKGLELLARINAEPGGAPRGVEASVKKARDQIMKLLMLDRENERLLLKSSMPVKMKEAYRTVAPGQIAKAYGKYSGGK